MNDEMTTSNTVNYEGLDGRIFTASWVRGDLKSFGQGYTKITELNNKHVISNRFMDKNEFINWTKSLPIITVKSTH